MSDVAAWAQRNGGLQGVRDAIANGTFGSDSQSLRLALHYIEREELLLARRHALNDQKKSTSDSLEAARRYALYSAIGAMTAVAAAVVAVVAPWTR
jgi:hypothetical protein